MKCCAVIDTNVIVSGLLTKDKAAPTAIVLDALIDGKFTPLYHEDILAEYEEVLHRDKFPFYENQIRTVVNAIKRYGEEVFPQEAGEVFIDMDDLIFYEVAMQKREDSAYLVTGNMKHYPVRDFIITPAEMAEILQKTG